MRVIKLSKVKNYTALLLQVDESTRGSPSGSSLNFQPLMLSRNLLLHLVSVSGHWCSARISFSAYSLNFQPLMLSRDLLWQCLVSISSLWYSARIYNVFWPEPLSHWQNRAMLVGRSGFVDSRVTRLDCSVSHSCEGTTLARNVKEPLLPGKLCHPWTCTRWMDSKILLLKNTSSWICFQEVRLFFVALKYLPVPSQLRSKTACLLSGKVWIILASLVSTLGHACVCSAPSNLVGHKQTCWPVLKISVQ